MAITKLIADSLGAGVGGKVLQVVVGQSNTNISSTSATFADTSLTANITPSATSSKILVMVNQVSLFKNAGTQIGLKLFKDTSELTSIRYQLDTNSTTRQHMGYSFSFLDTPSSTSELTYKTQFNNEQGTDTVHVQKNGNSTITLMEIAG